MGDLLQAHGRPAVGSWTTCCRRTGGLQLLKAAEPCRTPAGGAGDGASETHGRMVGVASLRLSLSATQGMPGTVVASLGAIQGMEGERA
jgi:hypothetical protein